MVIVAFILILLLFTKSLFNQGLKSGLESSSVRKRLEEDDRKNPMLEMNIASSSGRDNGNSKFVGDQRQLTKKMLEQQDSSLGDLSNAVDRLAVIGKEIQEESKTQTILLDNLEVEVDNSSNKMSAVQESLAKLLKTKDGCQIWTIVILTLILILLSKYLKHNFKNNDS